MEMSSKLKVITVIFLIIGFVFLLANFEYPHTVLVEKKVQVPYQVGIPDETTHVGSMPSFHFLDRDYKYFPPVNLTAGQTLEVTWYSDIGLLVCIFSQEQFHNFQTVFPQFNYSNRFLPIPPYLETSGSGWKQSKLTYDVTESGYYVAAITNINYNYPAYAQISHFDEFVISYTYQTEFVTQTQDVPQNDNLYLYIGSFLLIAGITTAFVLYRKVAHGL
jgi:hypothetical protein